jgi:RES domain-containing protein
LLNRQPISTSKPLIMSRLDIRLGKVIDLRNAPSLDDLGFGAKVLTADNWQGAQVVGGATAWLGFGGMLVPSARHADGNLVIFVNNLQPDDLVTLVGSP